MNEKNEQQSELTMPESNQQNILIGEYRFIPPPPTGYFKVLAKACKCDERTVRYALR